MPKNLVIVESPTKAKTLARYLGKEFEIKSSFGHIRDLPKKGIGVDIEHGFAPTYEVSPDKQRVAAELRRAAKGANVWLASDPDREGEAIAWHITQVLGLDPKDTKRIVFHEFTEPALKEAMANPQTVDMKLVDSQQARRILDRLVGYELSPVLWKKVRTGLSAGRVQSVAVRLIVEREREIRAFMASSSFRLTALFDAKGSELPAELDHKITDDKEARKFLESLVGSSFKVEAVEQKPGAKSPSAPFTTSTLQQESARRMGYSVRQTMSLAQRLYESGHITYMRTDSTNLSPIAINAAKDYITKNYGAEYWQVRQYKTKTKSAQEAHEAIRPSHLDVQSAGNDAQQKKLYELIWRRTIASQMAAAAVEKTEIKVAISDQPSKFIASGEVVTFDGFLKVYGGSREDRLLPPLSVGQALPLSGAQAEETFTKPPARYSEASLVRRLEELGIGRPSTYAPTIGTIQDRGYIEKKDLEGEERAIKLLSLGGSKVSESSKTTMVGADRAKLVPTSVAEVVTDFLVKHFVDIVDYDFTAKAEAEFDDIAQGKSQWQTVLENFYKQFHPLVKKSEKVDRADAAQARELGKDPKSGKPVVVRYGRYGPVLQLGNAENKEEKVVFAPLPKGTTLDDITLDKALPMFELPRVVGTTAGGEEITASIGRFGPYLKLGKKFVSLKEHDPLTISETQAREVIEASNKLAAERTVANFGKLKILRGPYGPYITDGKKNARIAKEVDPTKLTEKEAAEMLAKAPSKGRYRRRLKKD